MARGADRRGPAPALPVWWARLIIVVGAVVAVVSLPGVWLDRHVLDTERYTAAVAPLIEEPEVQERVADRLTDAVVDRLDRLESLEEAIAPAIREAVATERFAAAWEDAVRFSHDELVGAVRGESGALGFEQTTLYADFGPLTAALRSWLVDQGVPFADLIPDVEGRFVLVDVPRLPQAQAVLWFSDHALFLLAAGAVLLLVGVLLSPVRRHGLLLGAAVVAVGSAVVLVIDLVVRNEYVEDVPATVMAPETARLVYDALTAPIRSVELWTLLAALAVTAGSAVWSLARRSTGAAGSG